ncbi:transcriptional regulator BetI [Martelella mediterranea]|uniref:HTH-type transcriptional regulator BetI n=1 Tax=Martelella mediterranea TaxID=293089 RepID=A0A4R3NX14_9HYPH|nr:transcriptional regulator BetI [Martelella mediterranea]TCT44627.1 TetR family transcriptional regulator [Martelella mediterranea]
MPKVGMETIRRDALVRAAIAEVGQVGMTDVTVAKIARRAGVSAALAHHYFGSKDQILFAAMRRILEEFGRSVKERYHATSTPEDRLKVIIEASFGPDQFDPAVIAAWLAFYVQAQRGGTASRLLSIYESRLHSNLVFALKQLVSPAAAERIATGIGAMIDGFYLRAALKDFSANRLSAISMTMEYLDLILAKEKAQ